MHGSMKTHRSPLPTVVMAVVSVIVICSSKHANGLGLFPEVEITLANDGLYPVWFMCQMTDRRDTLYELTPNATYRFNFHQVAFPMRWCYLYISQTSHGFFWAFTVRSRCTRCFWSINRHPSLYRGDKGRWERQKLFMPPGFDIMEYIKANGDDLTETLG